MAMKVVLCAGHGRSFDLRGRLRLDPGAVNTKFELEEYTITKGIVEQVGRRLKSKTWIDMITMSDRSIYEMTLSQKIKDINTLRPNLAIEVHLNSSWKKRASGTEVLYYPNDKSDEDELISSVFQNNILKEIGEGGGIEVRNRGTKQAKGKRFLKKTTCPAFITESEFISNDSVADRLRHGDLIDRIVTGHVKALERIRDYRLI